MCGNTALGCLEPAILGIMRNSSLCVSGLVQKIPGIMGNYVCVEAEPLAVGTGNSPNYEELCYVWGEP